MAAVSSESLARNPPDWSRQTEEIHCPLCDYNLRGLIEPRCPECGCQFEWQKLLDRKERLHPYLFEHHPEKNIRSFVRTALSQLLPRRFWRSLELDIPSKPRRLVFYWTIQLCFVLACIIAHCSLYAVEAGWYAHVIRHPPAGTYWARDPISKTQADLYQPEVFSWRFVPHVWHMIVMEDPCRTDLVFLLPGVILFCVWPWTTFLGMQAFRWSLQQAQIRPIHLMRVLLYTTDSVIWLSILYICWKLWPLIDADNRNLLNLMYSIIFKHPPYYWIFLTAMVLMVFYRLHVALKLYLRLDRCLLMLLSTQIMLLLGIAVAVEVVPGLWGLVYVVYVNR